MEVTDEDKSNISNKNARINSQVQYTQLHQQKRSSTLEQIYSLKRILILRANQLWFKQDVKQYVLHPIFITTICFITSSVQKDTMHYLFIYFLKKTFPIVTYECRKLPIFHRANAFRQ